MPERFEWLPLAAARLPERLVLRPPASPGAIAAAESRVGPLAPAHRALLLHTNGLERPGLLAAEELGLWGRGDDPEAYEALPATDLIVGRVPLGMDRIVLDRSGGDEPTVWIFDPEAEPERRRAGASLEAWLLEELFQHAGTELRAVLVARLRELVPLADRREVERMVLHEQALTLAADRLLQAVELGDDEHGLRWTVERLRALHAAWGRAYGWALIETIERLSRSEPALAFSSWDAAAIRAAGQHDRTSEDTLLALWDRWRTHFAAEPVRALEGAARWARLAGRDPAHDEAVAAVLADAERLAGAPDRDAALAAALANVCDALVMSGFCGRTGTRERADALVRRPG